ncbi:cytochrome P450 [Linnemannia elongata AG-77]|uniref:Cytochrome P450 n=1 Tax=Linnemannia elongata AG-77 TaxID=1314771 RepID=A0A197K2Z4_9FUNG|nr:cytochrome P450 [Linnemannia elongata AG-77]
MLVYSIYILIKYRHTCISATPRSDLPGPKGHPLIGNTIEMAKRPPGSTHQRQMAFHNQYGKVFSLTVLGLGRVIHVREPQVVDHILKVNFWAYEKGGFFRETLRPIFGDGIFSADGQHWRWQRKAASKIFNVNWYRTYTSTIFRQESQLVINYFNKITDTSLTSMANKVIDLQAIFYLFTLDSFGRVGFGESFGCLIDPEKEVPFAGAFDRLTANLSLRFNWPFWRLTDWWTGNDKKVAADTKTVYDFAYNIIRRRRKRPGVLSSSGKDLMQLFMEATDENGERLTDEGLKDTLVNFLLAGRDTTAQGLSWMFYLIHRSQTRKEVLTKLREEIDTVLQGGFPTYETIQTQKYTKACFFETLRLYPSVPQNIRCVLEDDILPGGIKVYKGEKVTWGIWGMGRDTDIWGPDAEEFRPERWLQGDKFPSNKFVSFHLGPRTCLGQQFAYIQAITVTSMLLQKFDFELVNPHNEPAYGTSLTLPMANGLPVRITRRRDDPFRREE